MDALNSTLNQQNLTFKMTTTLPTTEPSLSIIGNQFEIVDHDSDQYILNTISVIDLIIILLGTLGNLTSFYLLTRKRLRPVSSMRYLAALTLIDSICLYGWYLSSVYRQLNDESHLKRLENISAFTCKFISYISFSSLQLSSFLLCMLTIDRLLIITSSKWRSKYANPKFANRIIFFLIMIVLCLNLVIPIRLGNKGLVQYKVKYISNNQKTSDQINDLTNNNNNHYGGHHTSIQIDDTYYHIIDNTNTVNVNVNRNIDKLKSNFSMWHCYDDNDSLLKFWNKLHLCLYSLIPFPILCILNLIVIRMTRDAAKSATQLSAYFNKFKNGQQFVTRLLLFLTISFFLTTLPSTIVYAFWHHQILEIRYGRVLLNILNTLQFSRHSSNWIIYVYSSSFMREEFKKCLSCADSEYEMAQAALAERPSIAIEILRQIENENQMNNNGSQQTNDQEQVDLYYLYCYYQENKLKYLNDNNNYSNSSSCKSKKNHNSYNNSDCSQQSNYRPTSLNSKQNSKKNLINKLNSNLRNELNYINNQDDSDQDESDSSREEEEDRHKIKN